jgi:hypothetical protein
MLPAQTLELDAVQRRACVGRRELAGPFEAEVLLSRKDLTDAEPGASGTVNISDGSGISASRTRELQPGCEDMTRTATAMVERESNRKRI